MPESAWGKGGPQRNKKKSKKIKKKIVGVPTLYFDFFRKNHEIENKLVKIHQWIHTIFQWKSVCSAFQFNSSSFWQHVNLSNIPQYGSDTYNI